MRKVFKKVGHPLRKPKCSGCNHLLEKHSKLGRCEAGSQTGDNSCECRKGPVGIERKQLAVARAA